MSKIMVCFSFLKRLGFYLTMGYTKNTEAIQKGENNKMPANVESMFSRVEVPWHGLGVITERSLTLQEIFQNPKIGLNWQVEKVPSVICIKDKIVPNEGTFDLVRMDTLRSFGQVTKQYTIVQNKEAGELVEAITGDDDAQFETAGVLDYGRRVWFLCQLKKELYIAGDKIMPFFLVTTSHDGKGGVVVAQSAVRVVCSNTLAMALKGNKRMISVSHMGNVEQRIYEKNRVLGLTRKYYESFEEMANKLVSKKISEAQIDTLIKDILFPLKEGAKSRGVTLTFNSRDTLRNCLAKEDLQNVQGTAWQVYNAVADYSDHERIIKGIEKDLRAARERNFTRSFEDVTLKDAALAYLLEV